MAKAKLFVLLVVVGALIGCNNYLQDDDSGPNENVLTPGDIGCAITVDAVYNETIAFIDNNYESSLPKVFSSIDDTKIERVVNCMFDLKGSFSMTDMVNDTRLVVNYEVRAEYLSDDGLWQFTRLTYQ